MALMDLFKTYKVSNPVFKLKDENIGELINNTNCVFYLQGNGINCTPVVKKGDEIKIGQVIGKENDDFSIPLISSVEGIVTDVKDVINIDGKKVKAIVVGNIVNGIEEEKEITLEKASKDEVLKLIQELALTDINGLPLSLKYRAYEGNKILIKKAGKEGNLIRNEVLFNKKNEINKGLEVIKTLFKTAEVKNTELSLNDEKLVQAEYGRETKVEDVLIEDLSTLVYIGEALLGKKGKTYEYITVFGNAIEGNKVVKVKHGTTLEDLFKGLNGDEERLGKVVIGGSLTGIPQYSLEVAISNNIESILFLDKKEAGKGAEIPCIRCSKCLRVCEEGLNPIKLVELWNRGEKEEFIRYGGLKCVTCGKCSYVCPSNIELAHKIKTAKNFIK